jgi:hypothetical protein
VEGLEKVGSLFDGLSVVDDRKIISDGTNWIDVA